MSEANVCRWAGVTNHVLRTWESGHSDWVPGNFGRGGDADAERARVVRRLADVYAGMLWILGRGQWPDELHDEPLRAAIERLRAS
jgi:hypothetical protein